MCYKSLIILLRHAKAQKNIEAKYGGKGSRLLSDADNELKSLSEDLRRCNVHIEEILSAPRSQCERTAEYLSEKLNIPTKVDSRLEPIDLGVIEGLTTEEVRDRYPQIHVMLSRWHERKCEVWELDIPEMEPPRDFYKRGTTFIEYLSDKASSCIIVGTRSVLVLLASVLLNRRPMPGGNYKEIPWPTCAYVTFGINAKDKSSVIDAWSIVSVDE